jgi:uncharacterized membrane protein YhhN
MRLSAICLMVSTILIFLAPRIGIELPGGVVVFCWVILAMSSLHLTLQGARPVRC